MKQDGIALIMVLVVAALLSLLVIEFAFIMRADTRIMEYRQSDRSAYHLGRGGVSLAMHILRADSPLVDSLNDIWAREFPPIADEKGAVDIRISDEDGKINVNRLVSETGEINMAVYGILERLLDIAGADPGAADAMAEELRLREGAGFFTRNEILDIPGADAVLEYVTIYTDGLVNINTALAVVLESLSWGIDCALAGEIAARRDSAPFGSLSQLAGIQGVSEEVMREISALAKVRSRVFSIEVNADSAGRKKNIISVVERTRDDFRVLYWRAI